MKAKLINLKDKLVDTLNELTEQHWLAIFGFIMLALVICSMIIAPMSVSASTLHPNVSLTVNANNVPFEGGGVSTNRDGAFASFDLIGTHTLQYTNADINVISNGDTIIMESLETGLQTTVTGNISAGLYNIYAMCTVFGQCYFNASNQAQVLSSAYTYLNDDTGTYLERYYVINGTNLDLNLYEPTQLPSNYYGNVAYILLPANDQPPTECPTLEEQIAEYDGSWFMFEQMLKANNYELWMKYSSELADIGSIQFSQGLSQGYQNGFSSALSGNSVEDPIDQYWNSTKDYILIAGQPYFTPNGFGSIDPYNTIGIYGEHESKLHKLDGTTQTFNGQYVTEFASTGTLGGGWYKLGATVGDEYAYEQTLTTTSGDKAYYVARVSPLGDPVEEFLVAIWVDGYEAWYVAEEYAYHGTVANNNKSYKQVYSIYMTDISPTSQRFVNYDNPILYETFNEDINATLYLATFNQLNNYNVYTDGIGIVEAYNNGYDTGANTALWLNLISQPIVAFFSIPLAQVIIEGVTYTLTYGVVLGAGIVALIVIWFLKLFAGG